MPCRPRFDLLPIACAVLAACSGWAQAQQQPPLPTQGTLAAGQATWHAPNADRLVVQQQSARAVIDWRSFSVGAGARVQFEQPNAQAAILNRVTGGARSEIAGQIHANGQVFLVNPNGITITPSGSVRAASVVLSTLDIRNDDFMDGRLVFAGGGASADVSNRGAVYGQTGGYAALLGGTLANDGLIEVPLGRVGMGAGERATLDLNGNGFLQVALPGGGSDGRALIDVAGRVSAPGGRIEIAAATARDALRHAIHLPGTLEANAVAGRSGDIVLAAGDGGAVTLAGTLAARSDVGHGGTLTVTGDAIELHGTQIDVSGAAGGGRVAIGGGRQGQGPMPYARDVRIDAASRIDASATTDGAGGDVVVWSDDRTAFAGTILARGAGAGRGGEAEVSGRQWLDYRGTTDLRAPNGPTGTLLLDPYNVTISTGADTGAGFTATGNDTVINTTTLATALGSANVTVSTGSSGAQAGDITVANPVTWSGGTTLTLQAAGNIASNAALTASAGGGVTMNAGGNITIANGANISSGGGAMNIALNATGAVTINAATLATSGGNLSASGTSATGSGLTLNGATLNVGAGAATLAGVSSSGTATLVTGTTSLSTTGGTFSLSGTSTSNFGLQFSGSTLGLAGAVTITGTSSSSTGLHWLNSNALTLTSGSATLSGSSTTQRGMLFNDTGNSLINSGSGSLALSGTTSSSTSTHYGLGLISGIGLTTGGTVALAGTATANAYGVWFGGGNSLVANTGVLTVAGSTATGNGMHFFGSPHSMTADVGASIALTGSASGIGNGIVLGNGVGLNASGAVSLAGSTQATVSNRYGLRFATGNAVTTSSGSVSLSGSASSSAAGISTGGDLTLTQSGSSSLSLAGQSGSGLGVRLGGGTLTSHGTVTITSTGPRMNIESGEIITVASGSLSMSGTGSNGLAGVSIKDSITFNNLAGGTLSLAGSSADYRGIELQPGSALATNGPVSLSGTSTSGSGFHSDGPLSVAGGALSLSGHSISGTGIRLTANGSIVNNGSGTLTIGANGGMSVDSTISSTGAALSVSGSGTIAQFGSSAITAAQLSLGGSGLFTLTGSSNQIGTVAGTGGSVDLYSSTALTVGSVLGSAGLASGGTLTLRSAAGLTLAAGAPVQGASPVLAAGGNFTNLAGSGALTATSGRWLIYAADPSGSSFGGLDSGSTALWNATYATLAPGSVTATGHRYLFATQPTLQFVPTDGIKVYGDDATSALQSNFSVSGYHAGVANAFLADTAGSAYAGAPLLTSPGTAVTAGVAGGPYAITLAQGSLTSPAGYALATTPGGAYLTVAARPITATADVQTRAYGDANPALGYQLTAGSLVNGDGFSGSLTTAATAASPVGSYAIAQGSLSAGANYALTYVSANLGITARPITITADAQSRLYGDANPALGYQLTAGSLVNGDGFSGSLTTAATAASPVGSYAIAQGSLSAGANYALTYVSANLGVTARPITITADAQSRVYGDANPALGYQLTAGSLVNGDGFSGSLATAATAASSVGSYAIAQGSLSAGANYDLSYLGAALAVTPRPLAVTADSRQRLYGAANPPLGYRAVGLVHGDSLSGQLAVAANDLSPVGRYAITQGTLQASANYALAYEPGTLLVTPREPAPRSRLERIDTAADRAGAAATAERERIAGASLCFAPEIRPAGSPLPACPR